MRIKINEIRKLLEQKLRQQGFNGKEARVIVDEYIVAELKGKHSHGIFGFALSAYRKINNKGREHFKIVKNKPAYAYIQGNGDFGQIVADYAIKLALKKARKMGIAMVGAGNIQPFLRPGTWAEIAAKKGMIGLCFNYGGGPRMTPTGGREPILAANPMGIGIPYRPFPIVIDMATSNRAFSQVKLARLLGKKIDENIGIDKLGRPTTDPNKLVAVSPMGGYKGYILALALEILTGPLVKTKVGKSAKKLRGFLLKLRGFLFIVINPLVFTSRKEFDQGLAKLIRDVKTAKRIKGVKEILIPGEKAYENEKMNLKRGWLEIDRKIIEELKKL